HRVVKIIWRERLSWNWFSRVEQRTRNALMNYDLFNERSTQDSQYSAVCQRWMKVVCAIAAGASGLSRASRLLTVWGVSRVSVSKMSGNPCGGRNWPPTIGPMRFDLAFCRQGRRHRKDLLSRE